VVKAKQRMRKAGPEIDRLTLLGMGKRWACHHHADKGERYQQTLRG
jgi:hypothetical protein